MPYADPEKRKEMQARSYRNRYAASEALRKAEAERKAAWLQTEEGKASNLEGSKRWQKKKSQVA